MKLAVPVLALAVFSTVLPAQGTRADYERANALRTKLQTATIGIPGPVTWLEGDRFYYRKTVKGGNAFVLVDAATGKRQPAFDHERLAAALSAKEKSKYNGVALPLADFSFDDGEKAITFATASARWKCTLSDYACSKMSGAAAQTPLAGAERNSSPS